MSFVEDDDDAGSDRGSVAKEEEEEEELDLPELTNDQLKMLYMISKFSHAANGPEEKEEWIRKVPLLVLIYEGIVHKCFDYDYAPASEVINQRRIYFNISQEGKSDVDCLREFELLNALKLSSKEHTAVTAFQISIKGHTLLQYMSDEDKEEIESFIYAPGEGGAGTAGERLAEDLLKVNWDGENFVLKSDTGYARESLVTDTEDVSYVSSPYLPMCLRHGGREITSNASKAHMSSQGETNIRDELDEVLVLNNVSILVGEYIPFGANQMLSLNHKLGVTERVQGGFFTALVDEESGGTKFEVPPGLTKVSILDYHITNYVNLEADIYFPEDSGIVQIENFGVHICHDGTVCYGMLVESVMDRIKDGISLDFLARLIVDVHQDSSRVTDSFISSYQLGLLDLIFGGDRMNRDKINVIIGDEVVPKLPAEKYMDRGPCENELKQCLGETRFAYDISEEDVIIFGNHGILLGGSSARAHEITLYVYLGLIGKDLFTQNFFGRCFVLQDQMADIRKMMTNQAEDPNTIDIVRARLADCSKDIIAMEEVLNYIKESIDCMTMPTMPSEPSGRKLYEVLDISSARHELTRRVTDLAKNTSSQRQELAILTNMAENLVNDRQHFMQKILQQNTGEIKTVVETNYSLQHSMGMVQVVMCGLFAFALLDRITGMWTITNRDWAATIVEPMLQSPYMWFGVNIIGWLAVAYGAGKVLDRKHTACLNTTTVKLVLDEKMADEECFINWKEGKNIILEESTWELKKNVSKVIWQESSSLSWGGYAPQIEVLYDSDFWFLNSVTVHYLRTKGSMTAAEIRTQVLEELRENQVIQNEVESDEEDDD